VVPDDQRHQRWALKALDLGTAGAVHRIPTKVPGWTKTFTDPRLCAAIVDRLTFGGNIIETGIDSYRLADTRQQLPTQLVGR
jgi:hypothetical protein